jgi:large subunit ribosomal protein L32
MSGGRRWLGCAAGLSLEESKASQVGKLRRSRPNSQCLNGPGNSRWFIANRVDCEWQTKGIAAMPNPKRRHSTRRTANRRAHDFLTASGLSECPNCHEKKLPHRACAKCGAYKGRAVLDVKEAAK